MKSPFLQLKESIFEVSRMAYETDDEFKEDEAKLENYIEIRNHLVSGLKPELTAEQRKELQKGIRDLDFVIARIKEELRNYLKDYLKEHCVKKEIIDQDKLDAEFEKLRIAHERIYLIHKHKRPDLVEGFLKIAFEAMTDEEIEQFWKNVRHRETYELNEILKSVEADATALRP